MNTATRRSRRCPECSGAGTQVYGLFGDVQRSTCAKCHGAGHLAVKPRRPRQPLTFCFSESSLRIAVEELQKAIRWRDLSRGNCSDHARRMARAVMRRAALNSRISYAGGLIQAN
ncbi:MAG: hypothetical protein HZC55_04190 [Verrucomicrobia bacterium]|nr:hypothetical protein [Verrucomicrobiota bacterium]